MRKTKKLGGQMIAAGLMAMVLLFEMQESKVLAETKQENHVAMTDQVEIAGEYKEIGYEYIGTDGNMDKESLYKSLFSENKSEKIYEQAPSSKNAVYSGRCGQSLFWNLDSKGTLTISGKGKMWDYRNDADYFDYHENPWKNYKGQIKKVVFEPGIQYIGASAFDGCTNLKQVVFSDTILMIGPFAFWECGRLENFTLPSQLQGLGQQCFAFCKALTKVVIPDSVTFLDAGIFDSNTALTYAYIGGSKDAEAYVYSNGIFENCSSLENILVSQDNIALSSRDGVLYSKSGDQLVQYPCGKKDKTYSLFSETTSIQQFSIKSANYLETVVLPNGLLEIGHVNFAHCDKLKNLIIPSSVTWIGDSVGQGCYKIEYITNNSQTKWNIKNSFGLSWVNASNQVITSLKNGTAYLKHKVEWIQKLYPQTMKVGQSSKLSVMYSYHVDKIVESISDLTFTSSNPNVVTIDSKGNMKALSVGTSTITVSAKYGTVKQTCTITVQLNNISNVTCSAIKNQAYTGSNITPSIQLRDNGVLLKQGTDYTVSYSNNKNIGTATIKITGKGKYTGTKQVIFRIEKGTQKITLLSKSYTKVVGQKTFSLNAKNSGNGKLTYTSSNPKVATVDRSGKVKLVGAGAATIKVTASATTLYNKKSESIKVIVNPKETSLKSVSSTSSKKLNVTWIKNSSVTGYEIEYSTSKSFRGAKTIKIANSKTTNYTISKLTGNKKYYVRIRTYQVVSKKPYYSAWSSVKSAVVKK